MPTYDLSKLPMVYKGVLPGTHWHQNDARITGFTPPVQGGPGVNGLMAHIMGMSFQSPFTSFTTSYAVAQNYASPYGDSGHASGPPGYVYRVDLSRLPAQTPVVVIDPIQSLADSVAGHGFCHAHNGQQDLLRLMAGGAMSFAPVAVGANTAGPVWFERTLPVLVFAARDAEILVCGPLPRAAVVGRDDVY